MHYHFPTKEQLIVVLVREYVPRVTAMLAQIEQQHARAGDQLRAYARLFLDGFENGMLPLLRRAVGRARRPAGEHAPPARRFFSSFSSIGWHACSKQARQPARCARALAPDQAALLLLSTLEGGCFVGWALQQKAMVLAAFEATLRNLETSSPVRRKGGRAS
ncbi:MAG: TetR/AcrR family transcriptional regulator [Pseudomonadota bacterium]